MEKTVLELECIGMKNGEKFPIENTGRGKNISPEFIIKNLSPHVYNAIKLRCQIKMVLSSQFILNHLLIDIIFSFSRNHMIHDCLYFVIINS